MHPAWVTITMHVTMHEHLAVKVASVNAKSGALLHPDNQKSKSACMTPISQHNIDRDKVWLRAARAHARK